MSTLTVTGLHKRYGAVRALDDAALTVAAGEVHALLGENGAGKSTLIKILSGAVRPDAGTIALDGRELRIRSPRDAAAAGIGTAFQELSLIPDLTVAQNLFFGREARTPLGTVRRTRVEVAARALLDELEIERIDVGAPLRTLPIAQRQLIEIAKALAREPRLLILDEATSALAPAEGEWLLRLARARARAGAAVLFISHRMPEIRAIADRVTVFRNGTDVGGGTIEEISDDEAVRLMLGRRVERLYPPRGERPPGEVVLAARGLRLGRRLDGVDLELRRGELLGVGGLQGQGQRELFNVLAGATRGAGSIVLDGRELTLASPRQALAAGIALVPEDRQREGLLLDLSIRDNVALPVLDRVSHGPFIDGGAELRLVERVAQRLQVTPGSWGRDAGALSGGNQQKVVLAKSLVAEARVLLLYDATRGVDVGTKSEIFALLRELTADGVSILFYSTDLQELTNVCDRVAVMSDGRIGGVLEGEALTDENVLRLSVGSGVAPPAAASGPAAPEAPR
jgi:ribose transport system ATP-binding protein